MADKSLFGRLKRLFSTNVIVRNVGGRKLKVADTEFIQSKMKSHLVDMNIVYPARKVKG